MTVSAGIRDLYGVERPTALRLDVDVPGGWAVDVPGLGTLLVAKLQSDELIVRLGRTYRSLLLQGASHVERDVAVIGDDLEVELLPNSSGEDRIVVVLHGAAA